MKTSLAKVYNGNMVTWVEKRKGTHKKSLELLSVWQKQGNVKPKVL